MNSCVKNLEEILNRPGVPKDIFDQIDNLLTIVDKSLSDPAEVDVLRTQLADLCQNHRELATYLILFGQKFPNLEDSRRRYIKWTLLEDVKFTKLSMREIVFNITMAEKFLKEYLTVFDPETDYQQMYQIVSMFPSFEYQFLDISGVELYQDFTNEEIKILYDCWSCIGLDMMDTELKTNLIENMDNIIFELSKSYDGNRFVTMLVDKGSIIDADTAKSLMEKDFEDFMKIVSIEARDSESPIVDVNSIASGDMVLLREIHKYTVAYLWLWSVQSRFYEDAKTFDWIDYQKFIHTAYQLSRWNYNNDVKGDN